MKEIKVIKGYQIETISEEEFQKEYGFIPLAPTVRIIEKNEKCPFCGKKKEEKEE